MAAVSEQGKARGVDCLQGAHGVALDAGDLDKTPDGITGEAEVMLHADLRGVFDLLIAAVRSNVRSKDRRKQEKREKSCAHRVSRTAYKRAKES